MLRKALPILRRASNKLQPVDNQVRSVWDLVRPSSDIQRIMREMDRKMEAFEREFFKIPPFRYLTPRLMPIEGVVSEGSKYRVDVDVSGFQPEDIKISLNDGKITIEAKMDRTREDGSRIQQHLLREFTLPSNLDVKTVESFLHNNGVLTIEGVTKNEEARKLPIQNQSDFSEDKEKLKSKM